MQLEIIGSKIYTEQDFHNQISKIFSYGFEEKFNYILE